MNQRLFGFRFTAGLALLALVVFGGACRDQNNVSRNSAAPSSPVPDRQIFQVRGTVRAVMVADKKVKIAHEPIPNYMDAMTMVFAVKEAKELSGIQSNDTVTFQMVVTPSDGWIEQLRKTGTETNAPASPPETFRRVREVEPLEVGDLLPNYSFTNEQNRLVQLRDFRGQALAFTFIFTRCPFPTFCPRLSTTFAEAQQLLRSTPAGPTNWHLFSISFDPEHDTPAVLAAYAGLRHAEPAKWSFLTGELIDITALGEQFGLQFWKGANGIIEHNVRTIVVDATGRVQWVTRENEFTAATLVEEMVKAARGSRPVAESVKGRE